MQCNLSTESFLRFPQHSAVYQNCPLRVYKMILEIVAAQRKIQITLKEIFFIRQNQMIYVPINLQL